MTVLFACICRRDGAVFVARTFFDIPKSRVEGLIGSFSKLLLTASASGSTPSAIAVAADDEQQHTFVEGETVRYLYSPLDVLGYLLVLATDKLSDCLQDVQSLQMCTSAISEILLNSPAAVASNDDSAQEEALNEKKFEILFAFDEIALEGRANSMLSSCGELSKILSMESQDEIIQNAIDERKEKEAKEQAKLKMKQIEMQKREAAKRTSRGLDSFPSKPPASMQQRVENVNVAGAISAKNSTFSQPFASSSSNNKGLKLGKGMKVAASNAKAELLMQETTKETKSIPIQRPQQNTPVAIEISELLSASINHSTGIESFEVKGSLSLCVVDEAFANLCLSICKPSSLGKAFQLKPHPNIDKQKLASGEIAMAERGKAFPCNQSLGLLKWKYSSNSDALLPLAFTCWPTFSQEEGPFSGASGAIEMSLEYEVANVEMLPIHNVLVRIPTPADSTLHVSALDGGSYTHNREECLVLWEIPLVDSLKPSGSISFRLTGAQEVQQVFPVEVDFEMQTSVVGLSVEQVELVGETGARLLQEHQECERRVNVKTERYVIDN